MDATPRPLRIWEAECTLLDAVLALSFDTEELLNCCFSAGLPVAACPHLQRAHRVRVAVHRACHEENPLSRMIERRLDYVHRAAMASYDVGQAAGLSGEDLCQVPELAAFLWALLRDGSSEASTARARMAASINHTGYELLARAQELRHRSEPTLAT